MTVASATSRIEYSTTAGLLTYAYPFRIFSANELEVHLGANLLVLNIHYSVTGVGNPNGGNIVFGADLGNGTLLTIERILPLTQGHDYVENDNFPADSHETALDRLTMITQMLHERDRKRPAFLKGSATKDWQFPDPMSYNADGRPLYIRMNANHTGLEAVHGFLDIIGGVLDDIIPSTTRGALPAAGTPGRLRRVTDDVRGVFIDDGTRFISTAREIINAHEFGFHWTASPSANVAALRAAVGTLTDATGHARYVWIPGCPVGEAYDIDERIDIPPNVWLVGPGTFHNSISAAMNGAVIRLMHDGAGLRFVKTATPPWHGGGIERVAFTSDIATTTATRFIELGDPLNLDFNNGCWDVTIKHCYFERANGGHAIYAAHSQEAKIMFNRFRDVKYAVYYDTVPASARILHNEILDENHIPDSVAIAIKPGMLGGASGTIIQGNYIIGYTNGIWVTSGIGTVIRDNTIEGASENCIVTSKYRIDGATIDADGSGDWEGCYGLVIDGNTFINWGSPVGGYAISLGFTAGSWIGRNTYTHPHGNASGAILLYDNGDGTTSENVIILPFVHDNTRLPGGEHLTIPPILANQTTTAQNTIIGKGFWKPRATSGDTVGLGTYGVTVYGPGDNGIEWWDNTNKRKRIWIDTSARTIPSILVGAKVVNFTDLNAGAEETDTIAVSGASDGDPVSLGVPNAFYNGIGIHVEGYVSGANAVTIKRINSGAGPINGNVSGTITVAVLKGV